MYPSRRVVLRAVAAAIAACSFSRDISGLSQFPKPPKPLNGEDQPPPSANGKSPAKIRLEENQKDIKKNIEKLFDLASQLKEQVDKTDATTTLSLGMVKKAEEIERLARQIKELAKG